MIYTKKNVIYGLNALNSGIVLNTENNWHLCPIIGRFVAFGLTTQLWAALQPFSAIFTALQKFSAFTPFLYKLKSKLWPTLG